MSAPVEGHAEVRYEQSDVRAGAIVRTERQQGKGEQACDHPVARHFFLYRSFAG